MNAKLFIAAVALSLVDTSSLGSRVLAQESGPICGPRAKILEALAETYHEAPVAVGIEGRGALMELLTTEDGSTWTLIASGPKGTCIIASGTDWITKPEAKGAAL